MMPLPAYHPGDDEIVWALSRQASLAALAASDAGFPASERDVVTVVTRPMWEAFLRFIGEPPGTEPTEWKGLHNTVRIWGSETHVIESDEWWSASRIREW